jgi:hypothetical protein
MSKTIGPLAWMIGLSAWPIGASASPGWMEISRLKILDDFQEIII